MKVIIEGEERIVKNICRENKVRVSRGQVSFSPADSIPTPEGVTEEDVKNMVEAIGQRDARIAELMEENETLKATLEEKVDTTDAPEGSDTKETTEEDTKEVASVSDTKGKKSSKK